MGNDTGFVAQLCLVGCVLLAGQPEHAKVCSSPDCRPLLLVSRWLRRADLIAGAGARAFRAGACVHHNACTCSNIAREQRRHSAMLSKLSRRHGYCSARARRKAAEAPICGLFYRLRVGVGAPIFGHVEM